MLTPSPSKSSPSTITSPTWTPIRSRIFPGLVETGGRCFGFFLNGHRAGGGLNGAGKLDKKTVAHDLEQPA
jgi:hypothetical protein